jgi:hypothetical protein
MQIFLREVAIEVVRTVRHVRRDWSGLAIPEGNGYTLTEIAPVRVVAVHRAPSGERTRRLGSPGA